MLTQNIYLEAEESIHLLLSRLVVKMTNRGIYCFLLLTQNIIIVPSHNETILFRFRKPKAGLITSGIAILVSAVYCAVVAVVGQINLPLMFGPIKP